MSSNNRFIFRRTDAQQRFEVLWKKRMEGEPTLKELAEMDEIINRDPSIYQFVLKEMENCALPPRDGEQKTPPPPAASPLKKGIAKVRSFLNNVIARAVSRLLNGGQNMPSGPLLPVVQ